MIIYIIAEFHLSVNEAVDWLCLGDVTVAVSSPKSPAIDYFGLFYYTIEDL
jgi:hypothetical protein